MKPHFLKSLALCSVLASLASCTTPETPPKHLFDAKPPYQNQAGWTVFTPSADSRIVYVSTSEGNDKTAEVYRAEDKPIRDNPRQPSGTIKPFKTFKAAFRKTRDGHPDWILLKGGDTFHGALKVRNGRASEQPFLLATYGEGTPMVKAGAERAINICCESFNDIAIQGIEFYAHTRDFDSPEFVSTDGGMGISAYVKEGYRGTGLWVEGCKFRFFTGNAIQTDGDLNKVSFRRNVILDNYSSDGHAQGLFTRNISITVEGNIFDHNGWYRPQEASGKNKKKDGQATMFNHNTYFQDNHDVLFRNNIFLRPSSIGSKWTANSGKASTRNVEIADNFYFDGEIGISIGGNKKGPLRFQNITVRDNVLMNVGQTQPTGRDFAWYLEVKDWDKGAIENNVFIHPGSETTDNIYAIRLDGKQSRALDISDNIIYGFGNGHALGIEAETGLQNIKVANNAFYLQKSSRNFVRAKGKLTGAVFADNRYQREDGGGAFSVANKRLSAENWRDRSGEQNSQFGKAATIKAEDIIQRYQASLGQKASFDSFVQQLRQQSYNNWDENYTAEAINRWIRHSLPLPDEPGNSTASSDEDEDEAGNVDEGGDVNVDAELSAQMNAEP